MPFASSLDREMSVLTRPVAGVACAAVLTVAACSTPPPPADIDLFEQASRFFEQQNYVVAIEDYDELLKQHPFSEHAETASLKIAHAYYLNKQYDEAIAGFNDFERLYPVSPLLPFVEYTVGRCYLDQALSGDRDTSASENALRQFERLRDRYPGSIYARLADFRIARCRENLAAHELYVGDYYKRTGRAAAARARYVYLMENFSDTEAALTAARRLDELATIAAAAASDEQVGP